MQCIAHHGGQCEALLLQGDNMAKFVVDRKTWFRGAGSWMSSLLRGDGRRCCIGFVGNQVGCTDDELRFVPSVEKLLESCEPAARKFPDWMQDARIFDAYQTNDDLDLNDVERESKLKEIFARHGDEIEFI
jgi:hypothetical protein